MKTIEIEIPRRVAVGEKVRFKENVPSIMQRFVGNEYTVKRVVRYEGEQICKKKWFGLRRLRCVTIPNGNQIVELEGIPERSFSINWFSLPIEKRSVEVVDKISYKGAFPQESIRTQPLE